MNPSGTVSISAAETTWYCQASQPTSVRTPIGTSTPIEAAMRVQISARHQLGRVMMLPRRGTGSSA